MEARQSIEIESFDILFRYCELRLLYLEKAESTRQNAYPKQSMEIDWLTVQRLRIEGLSLSVNRLDRCM